MRYQTPPSWAFQKRGRKKTVTLINLSPTHYKGLSWWLRGKESACQGRGLRFDPWVRKISWRRKWQPTPVFLAEEFHGQWSLASYSPSCSPSYSCKRVGHDSVTTQHIINVRGWRTVKHFKIETFILEYL